MYQITMNREHLDLLLQATDIMSRIHMLQFNRMADVVQPTEDSHFEKLHQFQDELNNLKKFWDISLNASFGINSNQISNDARTYWDMHQVLRNFVSYEDHPEVTPENRWKIPNGWTVNFDEVLQANNDIGLIKIEKVEK